MNNQELKELIENSKMDQEDKDFFIPINGSRRQRFFYSYNGEFNGFSKK